MNPSLASTLLHEAASRFAGRLLLSCAVLLSVSTLLAPRAAHADVPGRVGRIAFLQGDVQAYSETDPEWKVAYLNQPITSRNSIFVGDAGRAEISVGSTTLAMDAGSQVDIQQLDDNTFDANVVRGRVSLRVRRFDANDAYNVAVPGADFALLRPGRYRIDALQSSGGITVFEGQASVQGDRGDVLVEAGNGLRVAVNPADPNAAPQLLSAAPIPVALDDWVLARESRFRNSQSERYVSPNMTGYEDLDANGRWANEEDLGPVWYPTTYVQADWAPYRYGRWAYVAPWGYTWIDDAPWGFAPFHYGRWVQVGARWGWCPGAYIARPVYAPALVGFYGGDGFSASFSIGTGPAVGWYPLAPWQRYSPQYTRNAVYVNQVNNITIVNPPRRFGGGEGGRDWNLEHGGTIVPRDAFSSQRSISRVAQAAPRNVFDRARPMEVVDLPRPALIPGAVRRGPDAGRGDAHPEFRSPREFANRPNEGGPRNAEQSVRPNAPVVNVPGDRNGGLPPAYRRLPEDRRENGGIEAGRGSPPVQSQPQDARVNPGGFNRDNRPQVQTPAQTLPQAAPAGERQGFDQPRYTPRAQPQIRSDGEQRGDQRVPQPAAIEQRPLERQNREQRNVQAPPQGQQPQVVEQRQQGFERPAPVQAPQQPVERPQPRFERPVAPQAQPQPIERPQPQMERRQPIERPAPQAPAPVAQPRAQPEPQPAQQPAGDRPGPRGINNDR
jgi:hypothetical protein